LIKFLLPVGRCRRTGIESEPLKVVDPREGGQFSSGDKGSVFRRRRQVGCCGVDDWTKEDVAQFGYWIAPNARGRGYATRATILLTRWLFDLGAARVFLTIVAGNEDSVAVARRAGFAYEGTMRAHGVWQGQRCDVMLFAALPHEWAMRRQDEET
jgi:RimJ/RimL family protein N-acetyltransferase